MHGELDDRDEHTSVRLNSLVKIFGQPVMAFPIGNKYLYKVFFYYKIVMHVLITVFNIAALCSPGTLDNHS